MRIRSQPLRRLGGWVICLFGSGALSAATLQPLTVTENPLIWGVQGNQNAEACALSGNGLVVAFESKANQLVPTDRNGYRDLFVKSATGLTRISRRADLSEPRNDSTGARLSTTGRYVAFVSRDDLLNTGDSASLRAFHLDLQTATLQRAAVDLAGNSVDVSEFIDISGNGRYVVFSSSASNVVVGDNNNRPDIFRFDAVTGVITAASATSAGQLGNETSSSPAIDDSGNVIAFASASTNFVAGDTITRDIFVKDMLSGNIVRASQTTAGVGGSASASGPSLSASGAFVVFDTRSNLDSITADSNGLIDIYRHALLTGVTERVSVSSAGADANGDSTSASISGNGRYVWFKSNATNLVAPAPAVAGQVFRRDMSAATTLMAGDGSSPSLLPASSDDGQRVCFQTIAALDPADSNRLSDIYVAEPSASTIVRASVADSVVPTTFGSNGSALLDVTPDAGRVLSLSAAKDLDEASFATIPSASQLLEIEPALAEIRPLARNAGGMLPVGGISNARISSDGNWVVFDSLDPNLVPGDVNDRNDTFRLNLSSGVINAVSVNAAGTPQGDSLFASQINSNGTRVAFISNATTLVAGDTNGFSDVFVWDTTAATPIRRVSIATGGAQSNNTVSDAFGIDDAGNRVVFQTRASNLVAGDTNNTDDVFLHIIDTGITTRISVDNGGAQLSENAINPSISSDGRYIAYAVRAAEEELYLYDTVSQSRTRITPPAGVSPVGVSLRFGRDPRYLGYVGRGGDGKDRAYRYDRLATNANFELLRLTNDEPFRPEFIADVRIASATHAVVNTNVPLGDNDRNGAEDLLLVTLEGGTVALAGGTLSVPEGIGSVDIAVTRSGGSDGLVNVSGSFSPITAQAADFSVSQSLALWESGVSGVANLRINIVDDALPEPAETLQVTLVGPGGGVALGTPTTLTIEIRASDLPDLVFSNGFEN